MHILRDSITKCYNRINEAMRFLKEDEDEKEQQPLPDAEHVFSRDPNPIRSQLALNCWLFELELSMWALSAFREYHLVMFERQSSVNSMLHVLDVLSACEDAEFAKQMTSTMVVLFSCVPMITLSQLCHHCSHLYAKLMPRIRASMEIEQQLEDEIMQKELQRQQLTEELQQQKEEGLDAPEFQTSSEEEEQLRIVRRKCGAQHEVTADLQRQLYRSNLPLQIVQHCTLELTQELTNEILACVNSGLVYVFLTDKQSAEIQALARSPKEPCADDDDLKDDRQLELTKSFALLNYAHLFARPVRYAQLLVDCARRSAIKGLRKSCTRCRRVLDYLFDDLDRSATVLENKLLKDVEQMQHTLFVRVSTTWTRSNVDLRCTVYRASFHVTQYALSALTNVLDGSCDQVHFSHSVNL